MIKVYVLTFLALSLFLTFLAYRVGKLKTATKQKPKTKSSLDEKIEEIKAEIEALENSLPEEIEANSAKIVELKAQLEDIKTIKKRFN